jgi:hypothetical protein
LLVLIYERAILFVNRLHFVNMRSGALDLSSSCFKKTALQGSKAFPFLLNLTIFAAE